MYDCEWNNERLMICNQNLLPKFVGDDGGSGSGREGQKAGGYISPRWSFLPFENPPPR
jgi:hypothetical protein